MLAYRAPGMDDAEDLLFKALADPTRRALLDALVERDGQTLFELCTRMADRPRVALTRQAVSQHLDVLEAAGLLHVRRAGRYRLHDVDLTPLRPLRERWVRDEERTQR